MRKIILCIIREEEPGYAGAFRTGIKYVTKKRMLVLDADGSHNPKNIADISRMFDRGGYDIVIGSRYTKGGVSNDSKTSYIMSKILNTTMRLCLGIRAKDISTSYRMYDAKQIKAVTLTRNNYDVLREVIPRMKINKRERGKKLNIGETPITFNKRMYGGIQTSAFEIYQRLYRYVVYADPHKSGILIKKIKKEIILKIQTGGLMHEKRQP